MTGENRIPAGVPTGGQFAASQRAESVVGLPHPGRDDDGRVPRRPDGSVDTDAAVRADLVKGFNTTPWPEPRTLTLVGHWDGNTLVIESTYDGEEQDDRVDEGYWPEGLWASSGTGTSEAEIAASMLDEYEECDRIRVAVFEDDYTPSDDDEEWDDEDEEWEE